MASFSSVPSSRSSSPLPADGDSWSMNEVASVDGDSRPGSRPASPTPAAKPNGKLGGASVREGPLTATSARPEAKITFDIRAHSAEQKSAHQQAFTEQNANRAELGKAEKDFEATHVYQFTTRATLYKASLKAQIKFNKSTSLVRLEQAHTDYLDALNRSALPPDEQHKKYSEFQKAVQNARATRLKAATHEDLSVGCSSQMLKYYAPQDVAAKTAAADSEKLVQKLLRDIQQPHPELRNKSLSESLCFRINKTDLKMRPIYHFKPERIRAHIAICYMAFALVRQLEYRTKLLKKLSVASIIEELNSVQSSIYIHKVTKDRYRMPGSFSNEARKIYSAIGVQRNLDPRPIL